MDEVKIKVDVSDIYNRLTASEKELFNNVVISNVEICNSMIIISGIVIKDEKCL